MSIQKFSTLAIACSIVLSGNIAARASDTDEVRIHKTGVPVQSQTVTRTNDDPVIMRDDLGNTTVVPGASTVETQTTDTAPLQNTVVEKKSKRASHHLINLFGVKVL